MVKIFPNNPKETLAENCNAVQASDPDLFMRVCWPVNNSHVRVSDNGTVEYSNHRYWYPMEPGSFEEVRGWNNPAAPDKDIFLFGMGAGGQLADLLKRFTNLRITAWERDPWLVRLSLQRYDYSESLRKGRLKILMGADILNRDGIPHGTQMLCHPFLETIYRRELRLINNPSQHPAALICEGTLYVDDMAEALNKRGYRVYTMHMEILAREEMHYSVETSGARVLGCVNYKYMLSEFCHEENLKRRKPLVLDREEQRVYASPVSYVGASLVNDAQANRREFIRMYAKWAKNISAPEDAEQKLNWAESEQKKDYFKYVFGKHLKEQFYEFMTYAHQEYPYLNMEMMAAQGSASAKRLKIVSSLYDLGIRVWGDEGWKAAQVTGVEYSGRYAAHYGELDKVFSSSIINIDIGRIYQSDIITMRVFDALACGGFLLAEYSEALEECFEIGTEIETYSSIDELREKVSFYLANPEKRLSLIKNGRKAVLERHSLKQKFETIFEAAGV